MTLRRSPTGPSTKLISVRVTPRESLDSRWLAKHRECQSESELIRLLLTEELDRLVAAGVKVPRR